MPFGKGRRKWAVGLAGFLLLVVALWLSIPAWLPWILGPLASRAGVRFKLYERVGYSRFQLRDLNITNNSLELHAARVEAFVPNLWLWRLAFARSTGAGSFVQVDDWTCRLLPSNKPAGSASASVQGAALALQKLKRWVPAAVATNGVLRSGQLVFSLRRAALRDGNVSVELTLPPQASGQSVSATARPGRPMLLQLRCPALDLDSSLVISTNVAGFEVQSTTFWQSNRFELQMRFGSTGTLPETASLRATNFSLPAAVLKLPYYDSINGSLVAAWQKGLFDFELSAWAKPAAIETNWPVADLQLRLRGDTNAAVVERFSVDSAFLRASLSDPVEVRFAAPFLQGRAKLDLTADLDRQSWLPIGGQVAGSVDVAPGPGQVPRCDLRLIATNLGTTLVKANSATISANLLWPSLHLVDAETRFDDGSVGRITGQLNVPEKSVLGGNFHFQGPLARRWLPAFYSFRNLTLEGNFAGPITNLTHSGQLRLTQIAMPRLRPLVLDTRWNGEAMNLEHFSVVVASTNAALTAAGSLTLSTDTLQLTLEKLFLQTNGFNALQLQNPCTVNYSSVASAQSWRLSVSPLDLQGSAGELKAQALVRWPEQGELALGLQRFPIQLLTAFTEAEIPEVRISQLQASAAWSNSPAVSQLSLSGTGRFFSTREKEVPKKHPTGLEDRQEALPAELLSTPLTLDLNLAANSSGVVLSNLVVNSPTSVVATASGFVPVTFNPAGRSDLVELRSDAPLSLKCSVRPQAFFWEAVSELAGIRLQDPSLDLELAGTWQTPEGRLLAVAPRIQLKDASLTNLDLSDLRLSVSINRDRLRLDEGRVLVQGQRVGLTGDLPFEQKSWRELVHGKLPPWEKATAQVRIDNARLSAFTPLFPEIIAPQGELSVDLELLPEARLEGALALRHARTRPLGNTAPLRDINVTMRFHDRVLTLENASAALSGAAVELAGQADLRGSDWRSGILPPFNFTLRGTNVPLARQPEYIIRSDLDLAILKTNSEPPSVVGSAHLRDSFFLSDISALIPGKVAAPETRPPYFSIDDPTVAGWRLAITVDGVRWLKLRTSLFNGEVSANLHLEGTLKDPIVLGGLKVDSGLVRFPFASLQVQQGLVTLTSQDPYHPQLLVRSASKQFGYDIRMEVTGSAESPIIQFTSNPALSSEQILLMITAGQMPPGSFTLTPQQRAQTVALFLGRDLLSKLGLGDQSQDRLTFSSGAEITAQNRPTYDVEYKLTRRWSLTGEYDRFGDFNAGFKWRVYSK